LSFSNRIYFFSSFHSLLQNWSSWWRAFLDMCLSRSLNLSDPILYIRIASCSSFMANSDLICQILNFWDFHLLTFLYTMFLHFYAMIFDSFTVITIYWGGFFTLNKFLLLCFNDEFHIVLLLILVFECYLLSLVLSCFSAFDHLCYRN